MVGLGARLAGALRLPAVDEADWVEFIELLAKSFRTDTDV